MNKKSCYICLFKWKLRDTKGKCKQKFAKKHVRYCMYRFVRKKGSESQQVIAYEIKNLYLISCRFFKYFTDLGGLLNSFSLFFGVTFIENDLII
jgi:hypothetical protein